MLEDNQLPHGHLAPCGGVVVLEHIEDCLPQQGQILLGEAGGLAARLARLALAAIEAIGDDILSPHLSALFLRVGLGGDGHAGDGDLLGNGGFHARESPAAPAPAPGRS